MNIAILIDAENVLPAHADMIFGHAASLGEIVHREIFGAAQALTTWVNPVLKYAIHANLTIRASKGKNSSDIALVIGAMDLMARGNVDTVIIASSDSDFSALSVRLRNAGIEVIGMGTEKSNELWRTACSSFITLQLPSRQAVRQQSARPAPKAEPAKSAKEAPRSDAAKPAKEAPKPAKEEPAPKPEAHAAAQTHAERQAIIKQFIQDQLDSAEGRLQTNALFTALNALPEYRVDQQRSRRRPLNYLMRQYGDAFAFEDGADGNGWIMLPGIAGAPEAEKAEAAAPETATDEPEAASEPEPVQAEAPAEPEPAAEAEEVRKAEPEESVDAAAEEGVADPLALLTGAGLSEEVARKIVVIFTESSDRRTAYNRLRKTFGNNTGREYYQIVKQIDRENRR